MPKVVITRAGKHVVSDSIAAEDHGQSVEMRGYNNPASHMHGWPVERRMDAWAFPLIEIFCKHGTGHPMPESVEYLTKKLGDRYWGAHGCDGCCIPPEPRDDENLRTREYGWSFRNGSNLGGA